MVKKYAFYPTENPNGVPSEIKHLHLVRPVTLDTIQKLCRHCAGIEQVTMSASTKKRLAGNVEKFLRGQNITISLEQNRGRAIEMDLQKMLEVIEMRKDARTLRDIEKATGVPKSTVHYLIRYAKRNKVKKGKEVVYLK